MGAVGCKGRSKGGGGQSMGFGPTADSADEVLLGRRFEQYNVAQ
jgi:hypothetical protein